jgi:hypothetical protein
MLVTKCEPVNKDNIPRSPQAVITKENGGDRIVTKLL